MRKIKFLIVFLICGALAWYLYIKPNDYTIRFKIKTSPGTLWSAVEDWNIINEKKNLYSYKINNKEPFNFISETIHINNTNLEIDWRFKSLTDSTTRVIAGITEKENSIYNRITAPFASTLFKETILKLVKDYKDGLEYEIKKKFKVKVIGVDSIPPLNYAYVDFKNIQTRNKALQMKEMDFKLLTFINNLDLKAGEFPYVIVNKWNIDNNTIDFRYCFPVKQLDSLPYSNEIKFATQSSIKALKVIYNGNYSASDRGWFALHEYAKRNNISITNKPIEIYYNNPNFSGDEINWKTEIYFPIN